MTGDCELPTLPSAFTPMTSFWLVLLTNVELERGIGLLPSGAAVLKSESRQFSKYFWPNRM
ncbi:hypothetical protein Poly51_43810 [Rubripirellula tenax]|uniref:Uncharacterized protein n=1 Tax=Rubripirellula tenax TaxID=2528015 RepID=A0A5C6ESJ9_9BACT|nr:hypothetical protein Poly51_43810 [Rubripirellula tenax]